MAMTFQAAQPVDGSVVENSGVIDGKLVATGRLLPATANEAGFLAGSARASESALGSLTVAADGSWRYSVDNSKVQPLTAGQHHREAFTVSTLEGGERTIAIDVAGADAARNVIFIVGDGFGPVLGKAYAAYKAAQGLSAPIWEGLEKAIVTTRSADRPVTDSAAAGTALASGVKTKNGMLGLDPSGVVLENLVDIAHRAGKATGIVTNTEVMDGTPGAFLAHVADRNDLKLVARQTAADPAADLIYGAGANAFTSQRLIAAMTAKGYSFVDTEAKMTADAGVAGKTLGLFAPTGRMANAFAYDIAARPSEPAMIEMTKTALQKLETAPGGFFAMIEAGGLIDWAGHDNDAAWAMRETAVMERSVKLVMDYVDAHPDTLLVLTADHDTGGATDNVDYAKVARLLDDQRPAFWVKDQIVTRDSRGRETGLKPKEEVRKIVMDYTGVTLTDQQIATVAGGVDGNGKDRHRALGKELSKDGGVTFTTTDHSGVDVKLYAYGHGADAFQGRMDNTEVAVALAQAMDQTLAEGQVVNARVTSQEDGQVRGYASVYLEGSRGPGWSQETNLGDLTADANAHAARLATGEGLIVSLKTAGGIRASIGTSEAASGAKAAPAGDAEFGKAAGAVSQADIENALRFDDKLMVFDTTIAGLLAILNHAASVAPNAAGQIQIGGIRFSFDPKKPAGSRVSDVALVDENGMVRLIVDNGQILGDAGEKIRVVATDDLVNGGDLYPIKAHGENFRFILADGSLSAPIDETQNFSLAAPVEALGEQEAFAIYLETFHGTAARAFDQAERAAALDERIQNLSLRADATGSTDATVIEGSDAGESLEALQTGSTILGRGGDDVLMGGAGNDRLVGDDGADILAGRDGHDILRGDAGADRLDGGAGDDLLFGGAGDDTLDGGAGDDRIEGGADDDVISGGDGNDTLLGGAGDDTLAGGAGNDRIEGGAGDDTLAGGDGDDRIEGGAGDDVINGGNGADLIFGGEGDDRISGGAGDDTIELVIAAGAPVIDGGDGTDSLILSGAGAGTLDTVISVERLVVGSGSWSIAASQAFDDIRVKAGAVLASKAVLSGSHRLTIEAGATVAAVAFSGALDGARLDNAGAISGGVAADATATGTLKLVNSGRIAGGIVTGAGNDSVTLLEGSAVTGAIALGAGQDVFIGSSANETVDGGAGDDVLKGAGGDDTIAGGAGFDTLDLSDAIGSVSVNWQAGTASGGGIGSDRFSGIESVRLGSGDDQLRGSAADEVVDGGAGKDTLDAGSGNDRLTGGAGDDALRGGSGDDALDGGEGRDLLESGSGNDRLSGGAGDDDLKGGSGDDRLEGGFGNDRLSGGSGHDVFVFEKGFGRDVISDFQASGSSADQLEFATSLLADYAAFTAAATQAGRDVVITLDAETALTLTNVTLASLQADDFRFV